jgi:hypothetical protein
VNNNARGSQLKYNQNTNSGIVYKQILINAKLQTGKRGQTTELTRRSPFRSKRSSLECEEDQEYNVKGLYELVT